MNTREVIMPRIDHSASIADLLEYLRNLSTAPSSKTRTYQTDLAPDALIERGWCGDVAKQTT